MEEEVKLTHYQKYKESILRYQKNNPEIIRENTKKYVDKRRAIKKELKTKQIIEEYLLANNLKMVPI